MLFKRTAIYVTFILLLMQTPSMHGVTIFGYEFDVTPQLSALYSSIQNYMWCPYQHAIDSFSQMCDNRNGYNILKEILRHYPGAAPAFVKPAIDSFPKMCNNEYGWYILCAIWKLHPDAVLSFIQPAIDNFSQMCNNLYGSYILCEILRHNPDAAQAFTKPVINNFSQMCNNQNGYNILKEILKYYPNAASAFVQAAIDNFSQMCNNEYGSYILGEILRHNPDAGRAFAQTGQELVQFAINNFAQTCQSKEGYYTIHIILNYCPDSAPAFVQPAINNFSQMCNDPYGSHILCEILLHHPDSAPAFVQPAINNFSQMCNSQYGLYTLHAISIHYPHVAKAFTEPIINNFPQICNNLYGFYILQNILRRCPQAAQSFVQPAINNFSQICNNENGQRTLGKILKCHPDAARKFVQPFIENFDQMQYNKYGQHILAAILRYCPDTLAKCMTSNRKFFYPFNDLVEPKTQTKQHLMAHLLDKFKELSSQGDTNYQDYPDLQDLTKQIIDREHIEQQKNRYTFVHAHQWGYHFYQELYTDLWGIMHEQPNNYRFIRYKYPIKPSTEAFFSYIEQEQERRNELLSKGPGGYYTWKGQQDRLLFMNYALFVNPGFSNSGYYIKYNKSAHPPSIGRNQLTRELQLYQYFTQHEQEFIEYQLAQLQVEHASISNYGGCLLLSFTPELMAQCVYPCAGGGPKRTVEIEGLGEISDPQIILNTLRAAPEKIVDSDSVEFACVLSHDSTLIPNNGLDIYEFNAADQDKLAAWRAKKDKLMAWIKERVDKRRQPMRARL